VELPAGGAQTTLPFTGLSFPFGVAVDASGDVFAADSDNGRVVELPAGGAQTTLPFTGLSQPIGVAVDASGDVYATDSSINRVVELSPSIPPFTDQFLQPLAQSTDPATPVINTGKNGRVIPVKVQITQGGTPITDANAPGPVAIGVSKLAACSTAAGTDPITSYAAAGQSSAGTNQFRYDANAQAWVYNLDTKALSLITGNCYWIDVSVNGTPIMNAFAVYQPTK